MIVYPDARVTHTHELTLLVVSEDARRTLVLGRSAVVRLRRLSVRRESAILVVVIGGAEREGFKRLSL